ncbi:MAG: hypothetical protein A2017_01050 [Lentisphaerae bacterium GWF2_44_16]|nr:MAG: hypothetical protein A2017_01050 [Lentisphaerae bacterium GWF2_44_16]
MKKIYEKILKEVNCNWLMKNTERLLEIELGQTFENYKRAAEYTAKIIREAGIKNCEIINFPADGKTVYQDKRMPLAWNATKGRLTIKKSPLKFDDPVIADYERHPFHLVKGSVSTPKEGLDVRIITEAQLFSGEDAENCLVIANSLTAPRPEMLKAALDLGALGLVTDFLKGRYDTPDGVQWVNACTEGNNWHVQVDDRPFICFSISPRTGDMLRQAASSGEVTALIECDGVRSEGELPLVTALIPGRQEKELWIVSHLYEPLSTDNSSGVVASIEIARVIKKLSDSGEIPMMEFSLRLIFAMEMYGFAAFAEKIGKAGRAKAIGGINTDGMNISSKSVFQIYLAPPGTAFFGNSFMENLAEEHRGNGKPYIDTVIEEGFYSDDTFLSEPSNGIPTLWAFGRKEWWHNSEQKMSIISPEDFSIMTAFIGTWAASVLTANRKNLPSAIADASSYAKKHLWEEARRIINAYSSGESQNVSSLKTEIGERMNYRLKRDAECLADFREVCNLPLIASEIKGLEAETQSIICELEKQLKCIAPEIQTVKENKWFNYSDSIIPIRAVTGFPYDLAAVPKEARIKLPEGMIYGPFSRIFANMDGKKSLQRLIKEAEWETNTVFPPSQIKKYITGIAYLTEYGYLKTKFKKQCGKSEILAALKKAGIKKGDLLMVHSSLSAFGVIDGGVETIISALLESVGEKGTLLFPTFTRPYIYFEGSPNKRNNYRPHDDCDPELVSVGSIPKAFLKRKGVKRSIHATHSFAGIGPLAEKCLLEHLESDPPSCRRGPLGKLLEFKGKILHFGSGVATTTFLHFLEDEMNLPYLQNAVCRVKKGRETKTLLIPKHLPGHRDFYTPKAEECKFFKKMNAEGLQINEAILGLGKIQAINAEELYRLGMKAIKADPDILLCDSAECFFCSKYRKKK